MDKPISFKPEMVQAILSGRKTQTRRVIKQGYFPDGQKAAAIYPARELGWIAWAPFDSPGLAEFTKKAYKHGFPCPYGQPGDRLWVRETWMYWGSLKEPPILYRADGDWAGGAWRPSIHMPRKYSRLTLEVVEVRVQRVQEITEDDAVAEGMEVVPIGTATWSNRQSFSIYWDQINGKRGFTWASNPWVWVVEFKVVEKEQI